MENEIIKHNHGPNKIAHLQMIQGVIDRMGGESLLFKGLVHYIARWFICGFNIGIT